jgi:DNA-binding winged helix-turn-helix (wHTH) protein
MLLTFDGAYVLDTAVFELRLGESSISLEPQAYDVLLYLIEHRDRVVP